MNLTPSVLFRQTVSCGKGVNLLEFERYCLDSGGFSVEVESEAGHENGMVLLEK